MAPLRILHVGYGFRPLREGGLVAYWDDLSRAQLRDGHVVEWFCPGRTYPWLRRPRLHRWDYEGIRVHEVLNSPILVGLDRGTRSPLHDLDDPDVERLFARTLREARPDVVHVQELLGIPTAIIDVARAHGVPTVMTLQDYLPLCPTIKLFDADGRVNLRTRTGEQCARCCRDAPADDRQIREQSVWWHYGRAVQARPWIGEAVARAKRLAAPVLARRRPAAPGPPPPPPPPVAPAHEYQRRRDVNVERLGRVDRLIAMSPRVEEIYCLLGVPGERLRTMPLTLSHLAAMRPRSEPRVGPGRPLHLATSNGCATVEKGGEVVTGALERLHAEGLSDRVRFTALGYVGPRFAERLDRLPNVHRHGGYGPGDLDRLLDDIDVGIVPSIWEEAYGYVGPEYLAKGIPIIGNAIGGIPEYTRDGETGWLNRSCSPDGLAEIVAGILERPEQVTELHRGIVRRRPELIRPMDAHAAEMTAVYAELVASAAPGAG